jgi:hypothetical protein
MSTTVVATRNVPRWMLWLPIDPLVLHKWGGLWVLPAAVVAVKYALLSPVKLATAVLACWWAVAGVWWLGLFPVALAWGLDRFLGSPRWAASGPFRRSYRACQARGKLRRSWARFLRDSKAIDPHHRAPRHGRIHRTSTGVSCRIYHGHSGVRFDELADAMEVLTGLVGGLHSIKLRRVNPDWCVMYVNVVNPLRETLPYRTLPPAAFPRITMGRTAEGPWYTPTLMGRHICLIGETGAGKSSLIWTIISQCEQWDTPPQWWVIDPKMGIEMAAMNPARGGIATRYTRDPKTANAFVGELWAEAERRSEIMIANDWKSWHPELGPVIILVIDEFLALGDQATKKTGALFKLLHMFRAIGIHVLAATQLPQVDSSAIGRIIQLFNFRVVGACSNWGMAASALGEMGVSGAPAHQLVVPDDAGIFYAKEEGRSGFATFKAGWVDDSDGVAEHLPVARGELRKEVTAA